MALAIAGAFSPPAAAATAAGSLRLAGKTSEVLLQPGSEAAAAQRIDREDLSREVVYRVARQDGVTAVVTEGRGVRFLTADGAAMRLPAPLLIDADGRRSTAARWVIDDAGETTVIRLQVEDRLLRYPVTIGATSGRTLKPSANATGVISGSVTDASNGAGIAGAVVYIHDSSGDFYDFAMTNSAGAYTVASLATGSYRVLFTANDYSAELYNNIACGDFTCRISDGTAVNVTDGQTTPNISAALTRQVAAGGAITGTVTSSNGSAIVAGSVFVYGANGDFVKDALTSQNGTYAVTGLATGSYYLLFHADEHTAVLYNNLACADFTCDVTSGTAVAVTSGQNTANINAVLARNVTEIRGRVTSASGAALKDVAVLAYTAAGTASSIAFSDNSGHYTVVVPAGGTYYARTLNTVHAGYVDQLYSATNCVACTVTSGTPITVTSGSSATNIDFALNPNGGRISGRVTDAARGTGLSFSRLIVYNASGVPVSFADADSTGNYTSFNGLVSGNYYVLASAAGYRSEVYDDVTCDGCVVTAGTAVAVTLGQTTPNINFGLSNLVSRISGRVRALATNISLGDVLVLFYDQQGRHVAAGYTDRETGAYSVVIQRSGTYFARTANGVHPGYIDRLFPNIDCSGCAVNEGTGIVVEVGQNVDDVDFALASDGGSIAGQIRDARTNLPISFGFVQVYSASGNIAAYGFANSAGSYTLVQELTSGNYYVVGRAQGYPGELYNETTCGESCNPLAGTAVSVVRGQVTGGINFTLDGTAATLSGRVMNTAGEPLSSVLVQIFSSTGALIVSDQSDAAGDFSVVLPSGGTFYAKTSTTDQPQYADQIYDHRPCDETCDPLTGTAIVVPNGGSATGINFHLVSSCTVITLSPATLPQATVNVPYSEQITSDATVEPVIFTVTGSLPAGLTLSSAGLLSGTLTSPGTTTFTVTATDGNGCTGNRVYTLATALAPTTTALAASPVSAVYGATIQLTATVSPAIATGTVSFFDGSTKIGEAALTSGTATFATTSLNATAHQITATYGGSTTHATSTSAAVTVTIAKATPQITWPVPPPVSYGTALSAAQLNATATIAGTFTYVPAAGTILDAGPHTLSTTFRPTDTLNYNDASASVSLVVNKAAQTINWANPADIVYGTPLGATQLNATVTVPGPSPAGALTYSPAAGTVLNAGVHTLTVAAAETANYLPAQRSVSLTVLKASPAFADLSAPKIVVGTASVTVSGTIKAGTLVPPGSVTITVGSSSASATIEADGSFSATLATTTLQPVATGHPISFTYAGSANFNAASGTSTLTVIFAWSGGQMQANPGRPGSTVPIRIQLNNAQDRNISASTITVVAYGVKSATGNVWLPVEQAGGSDLEFRFQNAQGGSYLFNLRTTGLTSGDWVLGFKAGADPTIHEIPFSLR